MLRIINNFSKLTDSNLEVSATSILLALTGNSNFPDPKPDLPSLKGAIDEFTNLVAVAKDGGKLEIAEKNEKRKELITMLEKLAHYVLFTSDGDKLKALSSGFSFPKPAASATTIFKPNNLVLSDGQNAGELRLDFDRVAGAKSYVYQYTPDPINESSAWENKMGTVSHAIFTNLQSGKKYWCRVAAVGVGDQVVYSDVVSRVVQ